MRYAIYGGSSHLNRSVSNSLSRTQRSVARIFFDVNELHVAIERGPVIDILMLTDPASDPDLPLLLSWLEKQPSNRQPRVVTLRKDGTPSIDMDLVQIDNVTLTASMQKRVSLFRVLRDRSIAYDTGRRNVCIFDAKDDLQQKVFGRYTFQSGNVVVVHHVPVQLTKKLFRLAWFFFGQIDLQVNRLSLFEGVWGDYGDPASRSLDTHVSMLRSRLYLVSGNGYVLSAIYGEGYILKKECFQANASSLTNSSCSTLTPTNPVSKIHPRIQKVEGRRGGLKAESVPQGAVRISSILEEVAFRWRNDVWPRGTLT